MRSLFAILAFAVFAELIIPAYAEVSVSTDKATYGEGDTIVISGTVSEVIERVPLIVLISYGKYDTVIANVQVFPFDSVKLGKPVIREDGTWTVNIKPVGPLWVEPQRYIVSVYYNDDVVKTSFNFVESSGSVIQKYRSWAVGGTDYIVGFSIKNGQVLDMSYDKNTKSLKIQVDGYTNSRGSLTLIDIPQKMVNVTTPVSITFPVGITYITVDSMIQSTQPQVEIQTRTQQIQSPPTIQTKEIPQWVREVFVFWAEGNISDQELINAIEFLVKEGIIQLNK